MSDAAYVPPPLDEARWRRKIEEARGMTIDEKFKIGFLLAEQERIKLKNYLRSEHPYADDVAIQQMTSEIFRELHRREDAELEALGLLRDLTPKELATEGL